jgi:hypothetical protein
MRKLTVLIGLAVGFVLGSRAGRKPYEKLHEQVTRLRQKPEVQDTVASMKDEVTGRAGDLVDKVTSKVSSTSTSTAPV